MNDLKDKNIIITGASGGIGNSIVKSLHDAGSNILATGTKTEKLESLKSRLANIIKKSKYFQSTTQLFAFYQV